MANLEALRAQVQTYLPRFEEAAKGGAITVNRVLFSTNHEGFEDFWLSFLPRMRLFHLHDSLLQAARVASGQRNDKTQEAREAISTGFVVAAQIYTELEGRYLDGTPMTEGFLATAVQVVTQGTLFDKETVDDQIETLLQAKAGRTDENLDIRNILVAATGDQTLPTEYELSSRYFTSEDGLSVDSHSLLDPIFKPNSTLVDFLSDAISDYKRAELDVFFGLLSPVTAQQAKVKALQLVTVALLNDQRFQDKRKVISLAYGKLVKEILQKADLPGGYVLLHNNQFTPIATEMLAFMPMKVVGIGEFRRGSRTAARAELREDFGTRSSSSGNILRPPFPSPEDSK